MAVVTRIFILRYQPLQKNRTKAFLRSRKGSMLCRYSVILFTRAVWVGQAMRTAY